MPLNDLSLLKTKCYLNGVWVDSVDNSFIDVINPALLQKVASVPNLTGRETHDAINAAELALKDWSKRTASERSELLKKWFVLIKENIDDLAWLITLEQGKPLLESQREVKYAASFVEWFAEESKRVYGEVIPQHQSSKRLLVIKQPVGVTAAITPWNFPAAMITRKAAAALAAGCTMIVKPAPETPLTALALAELADRAGIPAGVFNVITGDAVAIGNVLCDSPVVRKLSFTGSTNIGRLLMSQCAHSLKKLSLELGGNAPFIVFNDADIDAAVEGAIAAKFRNTGQTCVCANRIYVQSEVYKAFSEKFTQAVSLLKVGTGTDTETTIGPLINKAAVLKAMDHVNDAVAKGAKLVAGGQQLLMSEDIVGYFYQPTVLIDVDASMKIAREETFGPVAPLFKFDGVDDVIEQANDTEFGLAAYFYGRDVSLIWKVSEALEYGMVGVNTGIISTEVAPFGGIKASGLGREGGHQGIEEYLETKYVCMEI
ncbi:NAD-dependent succinate-semialdehyde dehydrogenase [Parashewanella spongiae]|uniref:NAD-dependent succinate-semialdehyde dehydrogenase n=1 Tax=Parashewanella spongiae TaxID=342950 RepID=A0A3A6TCR1_9GAMM|nr:NAD-dependent succinate-semialdehyde dehydrogenase [Parashewanella spongiae]MCL1079232.1 NAD-dependent succinate-semialdehyde dehydrogenase [Parashewanella spongiae]RJY07884.1 NAD-dependent succinate-semialdehyde dehydrogenase [Parashewanella spongiae]